MARVVAPTCVVGVSGRGTSAPSLDFTSACARFLAPGGRGLLSLKVESDRGTDADALRVKVEHELAEAGLALEEVIDLEGFEDKHLLFVVGRPPRA